jgi:subtilisin family serine protease
LARAGTPASGQPAAPDFVPGRLLVGFQENAPAARIAALVGAARAQVVGQIPQIGVRVLQLPAGASEAAAARAFAQQPEVAFAEPDRILPPAAVPNDPYFSREWHLAKISAPTAWDTTTGSSGVIIAILDTGVNGAHPDLAGLMVPGWNCYNNNADTADVYGHGTGVAGSAAATSNNGIGVAGVAWNCMLMPIRISDTNGYASFSAMADGLTWAADHGAKVANISYIATGSSTVSTAARYFQNKGGVVTVAAGNNGTFDSASDNPYVLTVSATDSSDVLATWSNTGNNVDVAAPGVSIYSPFWTGGYGSGSGTSFAAPIVAGIAALVMSANPSLTPSQVQEVIKQSADDLGAPGSDSSYGAGRVNAERAVTLALTTSGGTTADTSPPTLSITSPADGATVSGAVTVQASAADNVAVASVSFSVDGTSLGTDSNAPYAATWDTRSLTNGAHTLTSTATDTSGNTASAQVTVNVGNFGDTTAPTISVTSPTEGATIDRNVSVTVNAADDVGVVKVELYVDGKLTATSTSAPFTLKWNSQKAAAGPHTLTCKAYDAAGNAGTSAAVTVTK